MTPTGHRSNDVSRICDAALELPDADRLAFVRRECAGDEALRREVESRLDWNADVAPLVAALAGNPIPPLPAATASTTVGADAPIRRAATGDGGDVRFTAGTIVAGRFRIVAAIGRGGMGEVYRADDLELRQPVALKFLTAFHADAGARDRLRAEVRVARQIAHPNVCRVYDIGESDGRLYLTMEYVAGEDLAALLRRVGRLGSERTIEVGRKIAAGLAAMHARGIVHRDLKPHNVMVDDDGEIRLMDFGIAVVASELRGTETVRGTPAYMAPEQLVGRDISPRSDVYALGLVLYELCTGQRPMAIADRQALLRLRQSAPAVKPSALVPDVDPSLERVILRCLDPDPRRRPTSAQSVAAELGSTPRLKKTWRVAVAIGVAVAAALAVFYMGPSWLAPGPASALTSRDAVVVADFENRTGEPLFDGALKVALAVALEQSPFLSIYPEARARETLRLMERSPDEPITRAIAREIAQREQLKALLAASITRLGGNYAVALEAINAVTGDVLAREQAEAAGKEQVLASLGTVASRLREKLGESLASVQRFDVPLPRATTASLDALHAYALALEQGREVPRLETIPHLKRAIELDPTFALAYAQLSSVYANNGQRALAPPFSRKAFELRDRVSQRERFYISWRYYSDADRSWDEALELARVWTESYPHEAFAFNSLGLASVRLGQWEEAVAGFGEARRLDPGLSVVYGNLAGALVVLDRPDEARAVLKEAAARQITFGNVHPTLFALAFLDGDDVAMAEMVKQAGDADADADWALAGPARVLAYRGRVTAAREQFGRGILSAEQRGLHQTAATLTLQNAEIHATAEECREVSNRVGAGLERTRGYEELVRASRTLALCGAARGATDLLNELSEQFPQAYLLKRVHRPVVEALIALRRGEAARAIDQLEPVRPLDNAPEGERWPVYLRGLAYAQLKDWRAATSEFQLVVDHRGMNPMSLLHPLAYLGLARAHAAAGRTSEARAAYETLFGIWKDADSGLAVLRDARAEHARLR